METDVATSSGTAQACQPQRVLGSAVLITCQFQNRNRFTIYRFFVEPPSADEWTVVKRKTKKK